ncbi:RICIN domain-containing protein [Kitasatospora sp. NPDC056327]|uniref:RICIN domain-containing protein n=1 Tax=Kitasatospora sp. NPDC056327 TaxID=3345785 RepID=UPI0035D96750
MSLPRRTRATLLTLVTGLAAALPLAAPGAAHAEQIPSPKPYHVEFRNLATGKCLEVADQRTDDGAPVRQWSCHGGLSQRWRTWGDGILVNEYSRKCLDVPGFSTVWGTRPVQWTCSGVRQNNQEWTTPGVNAPSPGFLSSLGLVLDVAGYDPSDGATVTLWGANGGANQLWTATVTQG